MKKIYLISALILVSLVSSVRGQIFNYTGAPVNYVVPAGVTAICFTVEGAQGNGNAANLMLGGLGGRVTGQMIVVPGQVLQFNVGGGGLANSQVGGFNGGANGGQVACCAISNGGGGGGASDIRIAPYGLANRVAVGGGGGGTGGNRNVGCAPGCGGGGGGGYYGGGGGGAYGGMPGFGGSQVAGGNGGTSCCGCPLTPQPGFNGAFGVGGNGGGMSACNNQAANNPGCAGGIGGAATGGQGPNCTGGTGCPSTWAGASGGGGSNFFSGAVIGPTSVGGVKAGTGRIVIIPNCCTQPTVVPIANPNPICAGQVATLTASGAGNGGTYTWTPGPITGSMVTVTPTITTTYTVTGQNTLNCTGSQTITLNVNPTPTINPTSNSPICIGNQINLFANPTAPAPSSYTWTGPNAFTSNLQNPTIANASTVHAGTYTLKVTSALGCTVQATVVVAINPQPTVNPTSNSPVCQGQSLNLFANPVAPAPSTYTWTGPNLFTSNAQNNTIVNVTPAAAGNYTLKVTSALGCTMQAIIAVVINPTPNVTASSASVCPGIGATLNGGGANTYTWNPGNVIGPSPTFTPPATQVYTVIGTSAAGCTASATGTITINPLPVPLPNSNSPVCTGGNINLTVNAATSYTWTGPNAFSSNVQNPSITNATTLQAGSYTVKVTSALGCTAQAVVNVIVNPSPTITVGNTGPYCTGATIQLTVTASNTYTWNGPLAFSSNAQNPTIANSTTNMAGPYTVTVAAVGGCISTGTTNVIINATPNPTATSNSPVCFGKQLNLFVNPAASSYTWNGPSAFTSNAQNPSIATASLANSGNYTVTVMSALGCTNISVVNVVINPLPLVTVNNPTTCVGSTFTLTATGGTAYAWTGPNAYTSVLQNPPFSNAQTTLNGNYTVVATSALGCTNSAVGLVTVIGVPTISIAGTNTMCSQNFNASPNSVILTAGGGNSYVWTLPAGFSALPNLSSNPITLSPPVTSTSLVATMTVVGTVGACTSQAVYQVTVYPNPTITATSGSMCAGTQVTLTASNATSYTWSPSATLNTPNGPVVIANPAVTTVYSIIGSNINGCKSQAVTATASVVPNPTVTINPNPALICLNSSINLTASGATNYTWTPATALTSTNTANTTASPTITTTYSIIGSQNTCTNLATIQVSVIGLPTVSIAGTNTLCSQNFNSSINTTTLTAGGASTYQWTLPAGFSATPNTSSNPIVLTPPVTSTSLVATISVTGTAGSCTSSAVYQVTVYPNPTITATSGSLCAGTQVTLTASNATTYTWSPTTNLSPSTGPVVVANPAVTTVYSVIGGSLGCNSQAVNATASVVPNPTVTINPNPALICLNSSINLTASGATNYTWTPATALTSTNTANTTASPTITTTYSIIGSQNTCTNLATIQVSVIGLPTVNVTGTSTLCSQNFNGSPNTTTLTANGAGTYVWTLPAGFSGSPSLNSNPLTITSPVVTTSMVATMTVLGTAGTCTNQATYNVTVYPNPTITAISGSMCAGTNVTLTASNATTYTWSPATALNTTSGPMVIATPANTTVYSVIGGSLGCNSQAVNATASVVPNPTVTINPNPALICLNSSINLTASGATNYTWTPATALTSTNTANTTANPTVTTTYSVIGSQNTCTHLATVQVSVIGLPTVTIVGTNTLCSQNINGSPNITTLTASGAGTYSWTIAPGFAGNPSSTSNPITITAPLTTTSLVATMTVLGTAGTCTNLATYNLTVYPNPTISATGGSMCAGTNVTLTANNAITYTWSPAANLNTTSGPNVIANPANTTVYSVIGGSIGCNSQAVNVTASVVPNPTVTINPNPAVICLFTSINLTASGATDYTWSPATALTSTNTANTTANPTVTTTYSIIGSQNTCTNLATIQVSVIGLPTVSIAGTNTLCSQNFNGSPNTTTLTASGAGSYVWTLPAGFSGAPALNNNPLTVTSPVTSTSLVATMTVVGTAGTCTNMATYNLTVIPNPTIATTSGSMCAGTSVNLTASNATTYTWSPSATLNTANGPNVIASPAVTTVYSVIGGSLGCNSQAVNATANVVVNPTVSINPNPGVICLFDAVNLTASGATNYTWSPATALSTTTGPNTTANPTVTTVYTIVGEAATCTHVTTMTVTVLPLPTITILPSSTTLCMNSFNGSPNTVTLTSNGATTYTWVSITGLTTNTLNGSQVVGTSNGNPVITGSVIGANATCSNSASFTLSAIPNPVIATTSGSMCAGTSVSLTAANAQTYTWSPSATLNTANGPVVIASPAVTTVYSVIGSSVGCQGQTQNAVATVVNNPTVFITPFTPTICLGSNINLTGNGATNYTWMPNTAISSTVGNVVTVNPTVTTTYQLIGEAQTCTHTAFQTVTVVPLPIVTIALSSPTMCMNAFNGSINQINVTASGATTYNWTGFTGIVNNTNVGAQVLVTAIPNTPIGTGTVIGSSQTCTSSATFTVLTIPNPIIAVPSQSVCQFHSVPVSASGANTYVWSPANTLNSPTGATVIASPTVTTVYSIVGSSMNCQSPTETTTVTVVANPQIIISPATPTVCAGAPIGLTAFGANNYTWTPATNINTINGNFVIVDPQVTTVYQVLGEAATCTSTAIRMVSVIPLPDLQASSTTTVICAGDKLPINGNGAISYTWSPGFGLSNPNSNFVIATPTIPTTYTIIGNNGICTKTITFSIDVKPRPVLNLSTDRPKICQGQSATIFASGASSYSWHPNAYSNVTNTTMAIVTPSASFNFSVTGFNGDSIGGCPFTKEILIEVVPQVTASVSRSTTVCEGKSVQLEAQGSNTYQWIPFEGLNNTKIARPYAQPSVTTVYTVMVSNGGYCGGTATVLVKVAPQPTVNAGPDLTFNSDEVMTLDAKGTGTLTWIFGENVLCSVCPNSQITATRSGVYHVQATNQFGCSAIDDVWIEVTNDYPIFIPNSFTPNYDGLNDAFLVYGEGIIEFEMKIYNRWQHQIFQTNDQLTGWDGTFKGEVVKNDSYYYEINYKTYDGKKKNKNGYVIVVTED